MAEGIQRLAPGQARKHHLHQGPALQQPVAQAGAARPEGAWRHQRRTKAAMHRRALLRADEAAAGDDGRPLEQQAQRHFGRVVAQGQV